MDEWMEGGLFRRLPHPVIQRRSIVYPAFPPFLLHSFPPPSLYSYLVEPLVFKALAIDIEGKIPAGDGQDKVFQLDRRLLAV